MKQCYPYSLLLLMSIFASSETMAEVKLYGQLKGGVAYTKQHGEAGSITQMEDYLSKIGFKGTEELDANNQLVWQVESAISLAGDGNKNWNSYDTYIGVKNDDLGTLRIGYMSDGMFGVENQKLLVGRGESAGKYNDPKGLKIFMRADQRWQAIRYDMPKKNGFEFNVTHRLADGMNTEDPDAGNVFNQATIVAGGYSHKAWYLKGAAGLYKHQSHDADKRPEDAYLWRVLAGYDDKKTFVGMAYQQTHGFEGLWHKKWATAERDLNPTVKTREVVVSAAHKMGKWMPRASYAHGFDETQLRSGQRVNNSSYDQVIVGADYYFSKSTIAMTSLGWIRKPVAYETLADGQLGASKQSMYSWGLGLKKVF